MYFKWQFCKTYCLTFRTPQEFFSRYYAQLFANRTIVVDNLIRESCLPNRQLQSVRESLDVTNLPEDFPNYYVKDKQIVCKHSKRYALSKTLCLTKRKINYFCVF